MEHYHTITGMPGRLKNIYKVTLKNTVPYIKKNYHQSLL